MSSWGKQLWKGKQTLHVSLIHRQNGFPGVWKSYIYIFKVYQTCSIESVLAYLVYDGLNFWIISEEEKMQI